MVSVCPFGEPVRGRLETMRIVPLRALPAAAAGLGEGTPAGDGDDTGLATGLAAAAADGLAAVAGEAAAGGLGAGAVVGAAAGAAVGWAPPPPQAATNSDEAIDSEKKRRRSAPRIDPSLLRKAEFVQETAEQAYRALRRRRYPFTKGSCGAAADTPQSGRKNQHAK